MSPPTSAIEVMLATWVVDEATSPELPLNAATRPLLHCTRVIDEEFSLNFQWRGRIRCLIHYSIASPNFVNR